MGAFLMRGMMQFYNLSRALFSHFYSLCCGVLEEGGSAKIPGKTQLNSDSKLEEELRGFPPTEGLFLHLFPVLSTITSSCKEGSAYRNRRQHSNQTSLVPSIP